MKTSYDNLLQKAGIRMRLHGLRQVVDDQSIASCQQACYKLGSYPQACSKLFPQLVTCLWDLRLCRSKLFNPIDCNFNCLNIERIQSMKVTTESKQY